MFIALPAVVDHEENDHVRRLHGYTDFRLAWLASIGARDGGVSGHCLLLPSCASPEFRRGSLSTDDPIAAVPGLSAGAASTDSDFAMTW